MSLREQARSPSQVWKRHEEDQDRGVAKTWEVKADKSGIVDVKKRKEKKYIDGPQ